MKGPPDELTGAERTVLLWLTVSSLLAACAALWRLATDVAALVGDAPVRAGGGQ